MKASEKHNWFEKYLLEKIEWIDSAGLSGWNHTNSVEEMEPLIIISVGIVFKETDTFITIISHFGHDHNAEGIMCIPKVCIQKRNKLVDD